MRIVLGPQRSDWLRVMRSSWSFCPIESRAPWRFVRDSDWNSSFGQTMTLNTRRLGSLIACVVVRGRQEQFAWIGSSSRSRKRSRVLDGPSSSKLSPAGATGEAQMNPRVPPTWRSVLHDRRQPEHWGCHHDRRSVDCRARGVRRRNCQQQPLHHVELQLLRRIAIDRFQRDASARPSS